MLLTWQIWSHLSPRQGACEQQLSHIDTEWREADAPLFTGPLTFLLTLFLMPSQHICCAWPGKKHLKNSFIKLGSKKRGQSLLIFFIFFLDTLTALLRIMRKGMAPLRRLTTGAQHVFYVCLSISVAYSYNIDLEHPLVFRGPNSSFFGYSVLEHYHDNTRWWVSCCAVPRNCVQWCHEFHVWMKCL